MAEVLSVLGVEAARAKLLQELRSVVEFSGNYVSLRHSQLLCDVMTHGGAVELPHGRREINP